MTNQNPGYLFRNKILSNPQLPLMCQDGGGGVPSHEYFFSLKNVTFCGFHPRDHRYFGFITKVIRRYLIKKSQLFEIFLASIRRPVYRSTPVMCLSASPPPDVLLRPTGRQTLHFILSNVQHFSNRRAFRRFYQKYIETASPTEDIYLE